MPDGQKTDLLQKPDLSAQDTSGRVIRRSRFGIQGLQ